MKTPPRRIVVIKANRFSTSPAPHLRRLNGSFTPAPVYVVGARMDASTADPDGESLQNNPPVPVEYLIDHFGRVTEGLSQLATLLGLLQEDEPEFSRVARLSSFGCFFASLIEHSANGVLERVERDGVCLSRKVAATGSDQVSSTVEFLREALGNSLGLAREARTAKMRAYHEGRADAFQIALAALEGEA